MRALLANLIATFAHRGQVRKIEGEPYIHHPRRVAGAVEFDPELDPADKAIAKPAALLHDVLEDTNVPRVVIAALCGLRVLRLVEELTNVFTHEAYPDMNRARRKKCEAFRLGMVSDLAKHIKLLDLIDNLDSYATQEGWDHCKGFVEVFADEAEFLLTEIGDVSLYKAAHVRNKIYVARRIADANRSAE